jgi:hypothetical protein
VTDSPLSEPLRSQLPELTANGSTTPSVRGRVAEPPMTQSVSVLVPFGRADVASATRSTAKKSSRFAATDGPGLPGWRACGSHWWDPASHTQAPSSLSRRPRSSVGKAVHPWSGATPHPARVE